MPTRSQSRRAAAATTGGDVPPATAKAEPAPSPSPQEESEDERQYMMLRHSDDEAPPVPEETAAAAAVAAEILKKEGGEEGGVNVIPKSPDRANPRNISMRGRGGGSSAASGASAPVPAPVARQVTRQASAQVPVAHQPPPVPYRVGGPPPGYYGHPHGGPHGSPHHHGGSPGGPPYLSRGVTEEGHPHPPPPPPPPVGYAPSYDYNHDSAHPNLHPAPSWGSLDPNRMGTFDYGEYAEEYGHGPPGHPGHGNGGSNVITPAQAFRKSYLYPPSSPIKASPKPSPDASPRTHDSTGSEEELAAAWLPPKGRTNRRAVSGGQREQRVVEAKDVPAVHVPPPPPTAAPRNNASAFHPPRARVPPPQFTRTPSRAPPSSASSPGRPPLVLDPSRSRSNDSSESPLRPTGRIQVVGAGVGEATPWDGSLVSASRSRSHEESVGGLPAAGSGSREWERGEYRTPYYDEYGRPYGPPPSMGYGPPPPGALIQRTPSIQRSASSHSSSGGHGGPPPPRSYAPGYYPPHPGYPPAHQHQYPPRYGPPAGYPTHGYGPPPPPRGPEDEEEDDEAPSHPLLEGYNPHRDGIRPQFTNEKKSRRGGGARRDEPRAAGSVAGPAGAPAPSPGGYQATPRRRRRRNPGEKAAAAAAMAAAAAAALKERKERQEAKRRKLGDGAALVKREEEVAASTPGDAAAAAPGAETASSPYISEEELKTLGSGDDEDIPAAKRAAMASQVALRAAAGGSPVAPPKSAAEVDFDIADPPPGPVVPPSDRPVLDSATMMTENDVLCGRGGGTNSQMGNRRFRALVRDFQPTYLMAKRREKPRMARSVVLIVRHRGGRFLRRDDGDGRLFEVGDEKAEAKTSQALREGLDVRATKTAANTLMGAAEGTKKRKGGATNAEDGKTKSGKAVNSPSSGASAAKEKATHTKPAPIHAPYRGPPPPRPPAHAAGYYYSHYSHEYPGYPPAQQHPGYPPRYGPPGYPPHAYGPPGHHPSSPPRAGAGAFGPPRGPAVSRPRNLTSSA